MHLFSDTKHIKKNDRTNFFQSIIVTWISPIQVKSQDITCIWGFNWERVGWLQHPKLLLNLLGMGSQWHWGKVMTFNQTTWVFPWQKAEIANHLRSAQRCCSPLMRVWPGGTWHFPLRRLALTHSVWSQKKNDWQIDKQIASFFSQVVLLSSMFLWTTISTKPEFSRLINRMAPAGVNESID